MYIKNKFAAKRKAAKQVSLSPGRMLTLSNDPPKVALTPWARMTIQFNEPYRTGTTFGVTQKKIMDQINIQNGVSNENSCVKVKRARFYSFITEGVSVPTLDVGIGGCQPNVMDNSTATDRNAYPCIKNMVDQGTTIRPAKCGWQYGDLDANTPLICDINKPLRTVVYWSAEGNSTCYLDIVYSSTVNMPEVA